MRVTRAAFRYWQNYALAVAAEAIAPALRAAARAMNRGPRTDPATWRTGLILGHSHIGDVLYRTCSLAPLAAGLPDCRWDYLTSPSAAAILTNDPALRSVLPFTLGDDSARITGESFRALRRARYDVVLCTNTIRHLPDFVLAVALGIPNRVGFGDKGYSGLLTFPVTTQYPQPLAGYTRTLVSAVTGRAPDWPLHPQVFPSASDRRRADACLGALHLDPSLPLLACTVTTRQAVGAWPPAFFRDVLASVMRERAVNVLLCGGANDEPTLRDIAAMLPHPAHVVAGSLQWLEFAEVLRRCDAMFCMDSGPRHLANAVGTPVAFARNLAFANVEAGAYCANETDLATIADDRTAVDVDASMRPASIAAAAALLLGMLGRGR